MSAIPGFIATQKLKLALIDSGLDRNRVLDKGHVAFAVLQASAEARCSFVVEYKPQRKFYAMQTTQDTARAHLFHSSV